VKADIRFGRTEISAGFFLVLAVLIYLDTRRVIMLFILASLLHEAAHMLAIRAAGGRQVKIRLTALGAEIEIESFTEIPHLQQLMIFLSGPAVNIILAFASSEAGKLFSCRELYVLAGINLTVGLFNLLPAKMLDGGNALRVLCLAVFGHQTAIPEVLHIATIVFLITACVLLVLKYGFSLSLFIAASWMLIGLFRERHATFSG
jgi:stage IV sporulation protein FB